MGNKVSNIKVGSLLKNIESGEIVLVHEVDGLMIGYRNDDVDGEVNKSHVQKHFEVLKKAPNNIKDFISDFDCA